MVSFRALMRIPTLVTDQHIIDGANVRYDTIPVQLEISSK